LGVFGGFSFLVWQIVAGWAGEQVIVIYETRAKRAFFVPERPFLRSER
jgi:hypothetical protein